MTQPNLSEIKLTPGTPISGEYRLMSVRIEEYQQGQRAMHGELADYSASLPFVCWLNDKYDAEDFCDGQIIRIQGKVAQIRKQLGVTAFRYQAVNYSNYATSLLPESLCQSPI